MSGFLQESIDGEIALAAATTDAGPAAALALLALALTGGVAAVARRARRRARRIEAIHARIDEELIDPTESG